MATSEELNETKSQDREDFPSFSIPMVEVISDSANLHTTNSKKAPWQRPTPFERNGLVSVSCRSKDIVHGFYLEKNKECEDQELENCSLIVLHFRFEPNDLNRRIKKVEIMTIFSAIDADDDDPEVVKIVPDGFFWVHPTTQKETKKVVTSGKGGGGVLGAAEVGAELTRDKTVEREASNAGTVRGAMQTERRTFGTPNTATWTLMENTTDKTGAPVSMRAAILVKREHVNFQAHFTVVVTPDNKTLVKTWFKSNPKDEPVLYKVDKKPTNVLHRYDQETIDKEGKLKMVNNLSLLDLESLEFSDITLRTIWENSEKKK